MAESPELEGVGGKFYATPPGKPKAPFSERSISKEASDVNKQKKFWDLSAKVLAAASVKKKPVSLFSR